MKKPKMKKINWMQVIMQNTTKKLKEQLGTEDNNQKKQNIWDNIAKQEKANKILKIKLQPCFKVLFLLN